MKLEKDLATELGVDREILKDWRKKGLQGWEKKGNAIVWSSDGEHEIRNRIQREICVKDLGEPLPVPELQELKITKLPFNPKLVVCGETYVRVHNNRNFLIGMTVNARPPADGGRVWVMVGRCPRWRGKY
jgi:hypothetical protein